LSPSSGDLRALVVGLGSIGRRHARNWASLELGPVAICRQHGAAQPEPLGVEADSFEDLSEALARTRPDVVLVTNPTSLHVQTAREALRAASHVFVEKPLGCAMEGIADLLDLAEATRRFVMVGYNLRFHPGLRRLRRLADGNVIGPILSARAEVGEYLPEWHPWEDYRQGYSARAELGGGAILTFSHELDALCWLLGRPRRLTAMAAHTSALEISTDDVAEIVMEFESGAIGSVHVDYLRRPPRRSLELVGERGVLRWEYERNRIEVYQADSRQVRVEDGDPRFERNDMYKEELRHLVACIRGDLARPLVDGEQGAAILAVALAALRSAATGRTIDFDTDTDATAQRWLKHLDRAA